MKPSALRGDECVHVVHIPMPATATAALDPDTGRATITVPHSDLSEFAKWLRRVADSIDHPTE
jgi:hypothetical protein